MGQVTWRVPDDVLERVRAQATERGRSLNEWLTVVMTAAADPASAGSEGEALRERLTRAGLLETSDRRARRPAADPVASARAAAGRGELASEIVSRHRG